MRGLLIFISCVLLLYFVVEKSGVIRLVPYAAKEGPLQVEKTRLEWHPEKLSLFWKELFQKRRAFSPKKTSTSKKEKPTHRLHLKNGAVLTGNIVEQNQEGIVFRSEGVDIFFHKNEISSLEKK